MSAISFGVPRDIIRRSDELLTKGQKQQKEITPAEIVCDFRSSMIAIAGDAHGWRKENCASLSNTQAKMAAEAAQSLALSKIEALPMDLQTGMAFKSGADHRVGEARVLLTIWTLCAIEYAAMLPQSDEAERLVQKPVRVRLPYSHKPTQGYSYGGG